MSLIERFVQRISTLRIEDCFNPYADRCSVFDKKLAPSIRRQNLLQILTSLRSTQMIDVWVGRDLGYKGGRRTGLALTDEYSLDLYATHLKLNSLERATNGPASKERTAENIFRILTEVDLPVLTWNVFPLHPHESGKPFSNRQHTRAEAEVGMTFLKELCTIFSVRRVIAIGNDAAAWTRSITPEQFHVRHPSYGGQTEFLTRMRELYSLSSLGGTRLKLL
jgi:hypothetical protein